MGTSAFVILSQQGSQFQHLLLVLSKSQLRSLRIYNAILVLVHHALLVHTFDELTLTALLHLQSVLHFDCVLLRYFGLTFEHARSELKFVVGLLQADVFLAQITHFQLVLGNCGLQFLDVGKHKLVLGA